MSGEHKAVFTTPIDADVVEYVRMAQAGSVTWKHVNLGCVLGTSPSKSPSVYVLERWSHELFNVRQSMLAAARRWLFENDRPAEQIVNVYVQADLDRGVLQAVAVFNDRDAALLYKLSQN